MQFTEKHFVYDGINSRRYGLIFAHVNTEEIKNISGTPSYQKIFYNNTKSNYIIGDKWEDSPLQLDVEIVSTKPILKKEKREIEKWLFNRKQYCKLYIDKREDEDIEMIDGEEKQCYIECIFYAPEIIEGTDGIYGFKATMELSCPFAIQDEIVKSVEVTDTAHTNITTISIDTDDNDYVYPFLKLQLKYGNIFKIENNSANYSKDGIQHGSIELSSYNTVQFIDFIDAYNAIRKNDVYIALNNDEVYELKCMSGEKITNSNFFDIGTNLSHRTIEFNQKISTNMPSQVIIFTSKGYCIEFGQPISGNPYEYDSTIVKLFDPAGNLSRSFSKTHMSCCFGDIGTISSIDVLPEPYADISFLLDYFSPIEYDYICYYNNENQFVKLCTKEDEYSWIDGSIYYVSNNKLLNKLVNIDCCNGTIVNEDDENCYDCLIGQNFLRLKNGINYLQFKGAFALDIIYSQKRFLR